MPELVKFKASTSDQEAIISLLEETLAKAKAGEVKDIAIVAAIQDQNGPQFWHCHYGQAAYSTLLAGVSALEFDLHFRRYVPED
jgi:hypothetical protein